MHLLDFFMYFPCLALLWKFMDLLSGGQITEELGALVGVFVCILFTIGYIIAFAFYPDWNWIDIFADINERVFGNGLTL